ncbi:unnamed protein product [Hermetia illucens]|uniref:Uncharacterized protein n=1 Tax=Hermetia illucens TaxID=343691 RepID=A0A7R8UPC3_HERIL|nr:uncharacterized protein LOC119652014 [Hermetia illucens]CAD7084546.1 unnamed protein product [Hermetia illucens]
MQFVHISIMTVFIISLAYVCTKPLSFRMLKIECVPYDPALTNISCSIRNHGTAQNAADVECFMGRPLNDILIHMAVWKKLNGNFILTPINMTINACQYLSKNARVPFHANLIMKWVQSFSNINHTCPYSGHIFVRNLRTDNFRMIIPDGEYRMDVKLYEKSFSHPIILVRGFGKRI